MKFDIVVVGGGPGGYPAAIRAAQMGAKVAIVERDRFGGECTNYGCIPTKALLKAAKVMEEIRSYPFIRGSAELDYGELAKWVRRVYTRSSRGVEYLLRSYGVEMLRGEARPKTGKRLVVNGEEVEAGSIIIATGSEPASIPGYAVDGQYIHNNRTILSLEEPPGSILIIGGGYIGVEYATVFSALGSEVYIVELLDRILPQMDPDLAKVVDKKLRERGVKIYTGVKAGEPHREDGYLRVPLSTGEEISVEKVLVAVGRRPNSGFARELGVELDDKGFVKVDDRMATSMDGVYASGDVAGQPMLAHKAFAQAVVAGENAAGGDTYYVQRYVPAVVYTDPEIVSVGLTLEEAREKGLEAEAEVYPIGGVAKAFIEGGSDGVVKIVYSGEEILGIHIAAPHASELAGEATYLLETSASLEDLALTIHPHPTVSEALREAAEHILGRPIHSVLKKK